VLHIKQWRDTLFQIQVSKHLSPLPYHFTPPRWGLSFPGIEPIFDRCVCFGLLFTSLWIAIHIALDCYSHRTTTLALRLFYRTERFFLAATQAYGRSVRSRETVVHLVPFSKCTCACCTTLFVGNAHASPLSPTLHKYWILWTKLSTYKWRISTLPRASTQRQSAYEQDLPPCATGVTLA